jgi:hypothetical protein
MYFEIAWELTLIGGGTLFTSKRWIFAANASDAVDKVKEFSSPGMFVLGNGFSFDNIRHTDNVSVEYPYGNVLNI